MKIVELLYDNNNRGYSKRTADEVENVLTIQDLYIRREKACHFIRPLTNFTITDKQIHCDLKLFNNIRNLRGYGFNSPARILSSYISTTNGMTNNFLRHKYVISRTGNAIYLAGYGTLARIAPNIKLLMWAETPFNLFEDDFIFVKNRSHIFGIEFPKIPYESQDLIQHSNPSSIIKKEKFHSNYNYSSSNKDSIILGAEFFVNNNLFRYEKTLVREVIIENSINDVITENPMETTLEDKSVKLSYNTNLELTNDLIERHNEKIQNSLKVDKSNFYNSIREKFLVTKKEMVKNTQVEFI